MLCQEEIDWMQTTAGLHMDQKLLKLYELLEESIGKVFKKAEDPGERKKRVPKFLRKLYQKKMKLSKRVMETKTAAKLLKLNKDFHEVEEQLKGIKKNWGSQKDKEVVDKIKDDPRTFYRYARSKSKVKHNVVPLKKGDTVTNYEGEMAKIMSQQYQDICSAPMENIEDERFIDSLVRQQNQATGGPSLEEIYIDKDLIKTVVKKVSLNSAV